LLDGRVCAPFGDQSRIVFAAEARTP
jgi:hypothetical protein